ncbi:unnamed protein product [Protopolystoma xenopodis]|uniref:Uncharacterized protein n=1 Tax=Protopolystoma xenopodis TaxID=117903 RepID=A0A3S5BGN9_9PLAT|nr:unnamed protein product [Protopolystoma xenopodis]
MTGHEPIWRQLEASIMAFLEAPVPETLPEGLRITYGSDLNSIPKSSTTQKTPGMQSTGLTDLLERARILNIQLNEQVAKRLTRLNDCLESAQYQADANDARDWMAERRALLRAVEKEIRPTQLTQKTTKEEVKWIWKDSSKDAGATQVSLKLYNYIFWIENINPSYLIYILLF